MKTKKMLATAIITSLTLLASCSNAIDNTKISNSSTWTVITQNVTKSYSSGKEIALNGQNVTISEAGTYTLSGNISNGQLLIDVWEDQEVVLNLAWVNITNSNGSAIYIKSWKATINLINWTNNILADWENYTNQEDNEPNATLFAKEDLKIDWTWTLTVNANYNDWISSKDDLTINNWNIIVKSADDWIRWKDSLTIENWTISVSANGDALKTDDETKGNLTINNWNITLASQTSQWIKAYNSVTINNWKINISNSKEWIESEKITINGWDLSIKATDDGINVSSSSESQSEEHPVMEATQTENNDIKLTINWWNIIVDASGDWLDANGSIELNWWKVIVYWPTNDWNWALDYDATFKINWWEIIAFWTSWMAQWASPSSKQNSVLINLDSSYNANSKFTLKDSSGNTVAENTSTKSFSSVLVSTSKLKTWEKYTYSVNWNQIWEFTVSSTTTEIWNSRMWPGGWQRGWFMIEEGSFGNRNPKPRRPELQ